MPPRSLVRAFLGLYVVLGAVVLVESIDTVVAATHGDIHGHDRLHALILGSFEVVAAVLFLVPRTMRWGAAGLLVVFLLAFALHTVEGHPPLTLMVYAAGVLFVRVHGVQGYRWSGVAA
jgi:hypothetical protein